LKNLAADRRTVHARKAFLRGPVAIVDTKKRKRTLMSHEPKSVRFLH
jgi:hypothetical protein